MKTFSKIAMRFRQAAAAGTAAAFTLLVTAAAAAPLEAGASAKSNDASLRFARGELASANGLEDVHTRVLREARRVCRMHGVRDVRRRQSEFACRERVVDDLLAAIDSERLNSFHANWEANRHGDAG